MELLPFVGFGAVRFGMTVAQVTEALGAPDAIRREESGDLSFEYLGLGVSCEFADEDDERLVTLNFDSDGFELEESRLVGLTEDELLALRARLLPGLELDLDLPFLDAKNYDCDPLGMSIWVSRGVVSQVTLFPRFDESGEVVLWPELTTSSP